VISLVQPITCHLPLVPPRFATELANQASMTATPIALPTAAKRHLVPILLIAALAGTLALPTIWRPSPVPQGTVMALALTISATATTISYWTVAKALCPRTSTTADPVQTTAPTQRRRILHRSPVRRENARSLLALRATTIKIPHSRMAANARTMESRTFALTHP